MSGAEAYWMKLAVDYDRVWWLRRERRFVKDAFVNLIKYVRMESPRKGTVKFRGIDDLAYALRYEDDEVWALARMLECAQMVCEDDPIPAVEIKDGTLRVIKFAEFQGTDAERKRADRDVKAVNPGADTNSPDIPPKSETNTVSPDLSENPATNEVSLEKPLAYETGRREDGKTGREEEIRTEPNRETNLFDAVESALLDTPQFRVKGINSKLMTRLVSEYLTLLDPETILAEAWAAAAFLRRRPPDAYSHAHLFFRKWLKTAEANIRARGAKVHQRNGHSTDRRNMTTAEKLTSGSMFEEALK